MPWSGDRSVGVPRTLRLLEAVHKRWGKLPWSQVIAPAIRLAEEGFTISPLLNGGLTQEQHHKQEEDQKWLLSNSVTTGHQ
jgi:gamma-glutamyltranspeptidase / glutathione hydrolase